MNKAITEGLVLMPPSFSAGLGLWSREDGRPGQGSYAGQPNAAFVPADQDFGGCLELLKTESVQRLRCFQPIPMQPGLYLRVTVQVKAMSGALPTLRVAGWAGSSSGMNVGTADQQGPDVALTGYGQVVTISAIIGPGSRTGVDMVWGAEPAYGHIGLDLTGPNGGAVRISDIVIEDVTSIFHSVMFDWVDVRDYGARGDGVTNDLAAFVAADAAAAGKTVIVPPGTYRIDGNLTLDNPVRFEGTLAMPATARLACTRNYNLDTYAAAFGSELEGFRRALQVLFYFTDHVTLDLSGRRVDLTAPIDVAALAGMTSFAQRRVLSHGQLNATSGAAWDAQTITAVASYSADNPNRLTAVANVAGIPVGSRISGTGVGREVYVTAKDVAAGTIDLSNPLWGAEGTRPYTFERYRYMLDFSGFSSLSKFEITDIEFQGNGFASGLMLPTFGETMRIADCVFTRPKDRAITSIGGGCQGIMVDQCQFVSNELALDAPDRTSIALNVNANDAKIRNNRIVRFAHFAIMAGTGHMFIGNHFFQGDGSAAGIRRAGVVLTTPNLKTLFTGNYVDNCFIELTNEHDARPEFANEFSFGGLTITGNIFTANSVAAWFRWLVITPRGPGHFINGLSVSNNAFRTIDGQIDRVETVDTTHAQLDTSRFRNVVFEANTFNGIAQITASPLSLTHTQNTEADTWVVDGSDYFPFSGRARNVVSVVPLGAIRNTANVVQYSLPYAETERGTGGTLAHLRWGVPVRGSALVTLRCDNPV